MPQNLTVTEVSTSTVDLEWESSGGAAYYEISMIDQHGEYNKIATVPYTVTQYQVTDLDANTDYRFSVRAVSPTKGSSIDSPIAYATTLNGTANFEITTHPEDASTAAGKTATFTAAATYTDDSGAKPVTIVAGENDRQQVAVARTEKQHRCFRRGRPIAHHHRCGGDERLCIPLPRVCAKPFAVHQIRSTGRFSRADQHSNHTEGRHRLAVRRHADDQCGNHCHRSEGGNADER